MKVDRRSITSILPLAFGLLLSKNVRAYQPELRTKGASSLSMQFYLGMTLAEARLVERRLDCDVVIEAIEEICLAPAETTISSFQKHTTGRAYTLKFFMNSTAGTRQERPIVVRFEFGLAIKIEISETFI